MKILFPSLLALSLLPLAASAGALKVGQEVSPFSANDDSGNLWQLFDYLGQKNIVVYFYPAAMTGGCTKQACAYRDASVKLNDLDAVVVGVSGDSVNNLELFKKANGLNFVLLSDANGGIAKQFGVPSRKGGSIEREVAGVMHTLTRGSTTSRWTFIIDKSGKVTYMDNAVNAAEDAENVVSELKKLG